MDINNKVAIVTGGASGLGYATVEKFVAEGGKVAIFDLNNERGAEIAEQMGDNVIFASVDVTSEESVVAGIAAVMDAFGAIHVCVNCAGTGNAIRTVGKKGPFPLAEFNKIIQINLVGTFNVLRLAAEQMAKNEPVNEDGERGVIINTASVAAYEGQIGQAAYAASKGGIVSLTLTVARDLSNLGIRVNTVVPGLFLTPILDGTGDEVIQSLGQQVLYPKRLGKPAEIGHLVASIVENPYINGECIRIDGGIRMGPR